MSVSVSDIDEKKIMLACFIIDRELKDINCRKRVINFDNNTVYKYYSRLFSDDFKCDINGHALKMYDNHFAVSKLEYKRGSKPPVYYDEYTDVVSSITKWLNENYTFRNLGECYKAMTDILMDYRERCLRNLRELIEQYCPSKEGYTIVVYSFQIRDETKLCRYKLVKKDEDGEDRIDFSGTYEEVKDRIMRIGG